jgi:hypothetical protein
MRRLTAGIARYVTGVLGRWRNRSTPRSPGTQLVRAAAPAQVRPASQPALGSGASAFQVHRSDFGHQHLTAKLSFSAGRSLTAPDLSDGQDSRLVRQTHISAARRQIYGGPPGTRTPNLWITGIAVDQGWMRWSDVMLVLVRMTAVGSVAVLRCCTRGLKPPKSRAVCGSMTIGAHPDADQDCLLMPGCVGVGGGPWLYGWLYPPRCHRLPALGAERAD